MINQLIKTLEQAEAALGENLVFISDKFDLEIRQKDRIVLDKMDQLNAAWIQICCMLKKCQREKEMGRL